MFVGVNMHTFCNQVQHAGNNHTNKLMRKLKNSPQKKSANMPQLNAASALELLHSVDAFLFDCDGMQRFAFFQHKL